MTTLAAALELFLQSRPVDSTRQEYRLKLRPLVAHLGADPPPAAITGDQLVAYVDRLKSEPGNHGRLRKPSTIRGHVQVIKTFLNWCVGQGLIEASPADHLKPVQVIDENVSSKAMTDSELLGILEYYRYNPRNFALVLFLADTGCRIGGAVDLQISRLDLVQRRAVILDKGKLVRVLFGPMAASALATWLEQRPAVDHDYVWTGQGPDYKAMTRHGLSYVIRHAAEQTGAKHTNPHSLRHRVGITLAHEGKDPDVIRRKLNHSDVLTTIRFYMTAADDHLQRVSDAFAMKPAPEQPGNVIKADFRRSAS